MYILFVSIQLLLPNQINHYYLFIEKQYKNICARCDTVHKSVKLVDIYIVL